MITCFDYFHHDLINVGEATLAVWTAGCGEPLLLLHGYPENHMMWWRVAGELAKKYTVICPDTRGYGDSSCPDDGEGHYAYSKRAMGNDFFRLMTVLGYDTFFLMGHDRGARVAHQMVADHSERVRKVIILDIMPTLDMYRLTDMEFARIYYHWFFLIQPYPIPERLLEGAPECMVNSQKLLGNSGDSDAFPDEIMACYLEKFSNPKVIHATCEDYRAGATIDLKHQEEAEKGPKFKTPALVLWGSKWYRDKDMVGIWSRHGEFVSGTEVAQGGHFIPEENPGAVLRAVESFFANDCKILDSKTLEYIKG